MTTPPNNALERTAAPLIHSTVAVIQTRVGRSTVPIGGGASIYHSPLE